MWWQLRAGTILLGAAMRGAAQYRADLLFTALAGALYNGTAFLTLWVILDRFDAIAGWSFTDMALLYGMRLMSHGLWALPLNQLIWLSDYVREGILDRFLVRPADVLVQVLTTRLRLNALGDLLAGFAVLVPAVMVSDVDWNPGTATFLVVAVIGGALVEAGFQLGLSGIAFRTVRSDQTRFAVDSVFNSFGGYPTKIFGSVGQWILTVVLPVVFVAYLPASVLLGRIDELGVPAVVAYASPLAGPLIAVAGYRLWRYQLRGYASTGSSQSGGGA